MSPRNRELRMLDGISTLALGAVGSPSAGVPGPRFVAPRDVEKPVRLPPLRGATKREIALRVNGVRVVFLIDDSGSMYGPPPMSDAKGVRYAVALSLLRWMRKLGGGQAGVVHWGGSAPAAMALEPVDVHAGRAKLEQALVIPPTLGGNDLPAALDRASVLAGPVRSDETRLNVVISDGWEEVTARMHSAVAALPAGSVHMLLVTSGLDSGLRAGWESVAFGSLTVLSAHDTRQMAIEVARVFASALDLSLAADDLHDHRSRSNRKAR